MLITIVIIIHHYFIRTFLTVDTYIICALSNCPLYILYMYVQVSPPLQAGQSVRLFHREYECYIAAEGSFADLPPVVEDGNGVT